MVVFGGQSVLAAQLLVALATAIVVPTSTFENGDLLLSKNSGLASRMLTPSTDWSLISPLLTDPAFAHTLPAVPATDEVSSVFGIERLKEFVPYTLTSFPGSAALCDDKTFMPVRAGPSHDCTLSSCSGASGPQCRAVFNAQSILLRGKLLNWWAKALGEPAWMQFSFPAVPPGSGTPKFEFKFTLDGRYRPELNGGNACDAGVDNVTHDCLLCVVEGSWDRGVPAGVHVLWSAAGRMEHVVTGPFELGQAWDARQFTQTLESPDEFVLQEGEFPVVTLMIASQYPRYGEVGNHSRCSIAHNSNSLYHYNDKSLMVREASISFQEMDKEPPTATDWTPLSSLLNDDDSLWPYLPVIPSHEGVSEQLYETSSDDAARVPFQLHKLSNFQEEASLCEGDDVLAAARAGPVEFCDSDNCSGPDYAVGSQHCRSLINGPSIQFRSRLGTYWANALGHPAWMQFVFPAVPEESTEFHFSFKLDGRYRPELYGGNPCSAGSDKDAYECKLCTTGPWDHTIQPGVHVLWTAAGRNEFVITGPFDLGAPYDAGELVQTFQTPPEMNYLPGDYPIVTLMTFSQYPAMGEVNNPQSCSINQSDELTKFNDKPLMVQEVSLMYRTSLQYTKEPEMTRPRLYGNDGEWLNAHVRPFFDAPCKQGMGKHVGWFEDEGFLSIKSHFDLSARGFDSCEGGAEYEDIGNWHSLSNYFSDEKIPNQTGGFRAFHLLRRLWACANVNNGDYSMCEYNATETYRLSLAVAQKEMVRFHSTTWTCGGSCGGNRAAAFDLTTAEQVSYFVHFFDVVASQVSLLAPEDVSILQATLKNQMDLFVDTFWTVKWQLWNGNNWTPHLCVAALEWVIVFWHEFPDQASEVLRIVNDIMWLHRISYTEDGVYTEGVAMYGFMSLEGQMAMAALSQASFGFSPAAIDTKTIQKAASFFIASMSSDGYLVDFGDSHRKRGWSAQMAVVEAAIAPVIVHGENLLTASINSAQVRAFAAALYGSGGFYSNPWRIRGGILQFDSIINAQSLQPMYESQPLGGQELDVFQSGGYARLLIPLLDGNTPGPLCFQNNKCIDPVLPSLWDNIPYSSISIQARPNTFAHSEVDFATFTWSVWGSRLISDFGYGTIATSVSQWDMRRYMYLDNNPAGHNTVVIREAFQPQSDGTINFSQLNMVTGTLSSEISFQDGSSCVVLDGSDLYGASRPDGWLDMMKRYFCALGGNTSSTLILDIIQTKKDRMELTLFGSQYGGPDFAETAPASQALTIDEYFYTDTDADVITSADGSPTEVLPAPNKKWCSHVDAELVRNASAVVLRPSCGIGGYRSADGMGVVSGVSLASNGRFEYDGLVTSVDRWLSPGALKKRRFRFVTDGQVGREGDVRAFVLSPSSASDPTQLPPGVAFADCLAEIGCGMVGNSRTGCSCVQMCIDGMLKRAVVLDGSVSSLENAGTCAATSTDSATGAPTTDGSMGAPTTDGPTGSPTTAGSMGTPSTAGPSGLLMTVAPTSTPWTIDFLDIISDFSRSSEDEITMKYEIGKNRTYETFLYETDCATIITDVMVNTTKAKTNINGTHDLLTLSYSIDKSAIANSTIWNSTTNKIEICQVVHLIVPESYGKPKMDIAEDIREVDIDFDLSVDYAIENELGTGTVEAAVGKTNISSYVEACKCNGPDNFTCEPYALVPNIRLHVCIKSVSTDVEVKEIKSMVVTQGTAIMNVILNTFVQMSSVADMTYVKAENGVVVSTFVPTNIFNYTAGASINITGGIGMELVNSGRRLLTDILNGDALNGDGNGQEFAVKVDLQDEVIVLEGKGGWIDSSGALLSGASTLLGTALLFAYGVW